MPISGLNYLQKMKTQTNPDFDNIKVLSSFINFKSYNDLTMPSQVIIHVIQTDYPKRIVVFEESEKNTGCNIIDSSIRLIDDYLGLNNMKASDVLFISYVPQHEKNNTHIISKTENNQGIIFNLCSWPKYFVKK